MKNLTNKKMKVSKGKQDSQDKKQNDNKNKSEEQDKQDAHSDKKDDKGDKDTNSTMNEVDDNNQQQGEQSKDQGFTIKQGSKEDKYDEKMQAKVQQYREIPEDIGGLLRAFIKNEYQQNRYNEQQVKNEKNSFKLFNVTADKQNCRCPKF